jgi:hypothetical protein
MVEEMLAARGIVVSHETVRQCRHRHPHWLAQRSGHLIQQSSKPTGKTLIGEGRCEKFVFVPSGFGAAGSGSHMCHLRT